MRGRLRRKAKGVMRARDTEFGKNSDLYDVAYVIFLAFSANDLTFSFLPLTFSESFLIIIS
jgi:hypothetical protein